MITFSLGLNEDTLHNELQMSGWMWPYVAFCTLWQYREILGRNSDYTRSYLDSL